MKFYDISLSLSHSTTVWPGDPLFTRTETKTSAIKSTLTFTTHTGTHIDAPKHFLFDKAGIDKIPVSALIGRFRVCQVKTKNQITLADIESLRIKPGQRILFKTRNVRLINKPFTQSYVSLSLEAAQFLVKQKILLVGIDYFGIEAKGNPGHPVHTSLLAKNIVIVEGLQLGGVRPGTYHGAILPIKIKDSDGAPCRAVLWK